MKLSIRNSGVVFLPAVLTVALLTAITSCKKESEVKGIDYDLLYNQKWMIVSQATTPTWTDPATGKSYNDLFDFAKENFACVVDDYITFYRGGSTRQFYNTNKCPGETGEQAPLAYYFLDQPNDSLFITAPFQVPGQQPEIIHLRWKVLDLTNDKLVVRYDQIVPFTFTQHTNTQTYKAIP